MAVTWNPGPGPTNGNDSGVGNRQDDTINGLDGNDTLNGRGGDDTIDGGEGNDTIMGGTDNDLITDTGGPDSDDSIDGGSGRDTIDGGQGDDFIEGGDGNDSLLGGEGQDTILESRGNNFIDGGDGADTLTGGLGSDTILGGTGDDVISDNGAANSDDEIDGGEGSDTIDAGDGDDLITDTGGAGSNDSISAGDGNDTVDAGAEDDTIDGGDGRDSIRGGAGHDFIMDSGGSVSHDTIDGGDGNDTIDGGAGSDTATGGAGDDVFLFNTGDDTLTITDFGVDSGLLNDGDTTNNDFIDLTAFYDSLQEAQADLDDDGILNHSNSGTVDYSNNTDLGDGGAEILFQGSVTFTTDNTGLDPSTICFAGGTLIETINGPCPVEDITAGAMVLTSTGPKPVRWAGCRQLGSHDLIAHPKLLPVCIKAGALGRGLPRRDLRVSPQHRILLRSKIAERMFGTAEVLIPAIKLIALQGIDVVTSATGIAYHHLLFDQHEIIYAEGAEAESLFTGPEALKSVGPDARDEIFGLFPELRSPGHEPVPARFIPAGKKQKALVARHLKNGKELVRA